MQEARTTGQSSSPEPRQDSRLLPHVPLHLYFLPRSALRIRMRLPGLPRLSKAEMGKVASGEEDVVQQYDQQDGQRVEDVKTTRHEIFGQLPPEELLGHIAAKVSTYYHSCCATVPPGPSEN